MSTAAHSSVAQQGALEVDDGPTSDYDNTSLASSTQSLSSSIMEHVYANGRRYHRKSTEDGTYNMPSDETEQDRLDLYHHFQCLLLGGRLTTAEFPAGEPHKVLDCGTGTGIWALDFGDQHPSSSVLGVDLAPIQPTYTYPNVSFQVDDLTKPWNFSPDFDFIHIRQLSPAIRDWPSLIKQAFDHLIPGGQMEIAEHTLDKMYSDDDSIPKESPFNVYMENLGKALRKLGIDPTLHGEDWKRMMEEAGFEEVRVQAFKQPWGTWPKDKEMKKLGAIGQLVAETGVEAYGLQLMTQLAGMTEPDARKLFMEFNDAIRGRKQHVYNIQYQIVGRKPKA